VQEINALTRWIGEGSGFMRIFIAGCARSGTRLTKRLMNCFDDTLVYASEAPISQFAVLDQSVSVQVVKRTSTCYRTLPDLPEDIRLLYCLRHPFDVLTSTHPLTAHRRRYHVTQERWLAEYHALRDLRTRQPERAIFFSRYEDLVADPDSVQQKISAFFDLTSTRRFSENPVHSKSIEKWRSQPRLRRHIRSLPAGFLGSVQAFCDEFGYDGTPPRRSLREMMGMSRWRRLKQAGEASIP
jgi:hypothetical protein